jgi:chromosome segregation ATPase
MKQLVTKEEVASAIERLTTSGQKPTLAAIHATLGRGSMTTLVRLKAELEQSPVEQPEAPEVLDHFRSIWTTAKSAGRSERDEELNRSAENLAAVLTDNDKLESAHAGITARLAEVEAQRDSLVAQLAESNHAATAARAAGETHASALAAALTRINQLTGVAVETQDKLQQSINSLRDDNRELLITHATLTAKLEAAYQAEAEQRTQARRSYDTSERLRSDLLEVSARLRVAETDAAKAQSHKPESRSSRRSRPVPNPNAENPTTDQAGQIAPTAKVNRRKP